MGTHRNSVPDGHATAGAGTTVAKALPTVAAGLALISLRPMAGPLTPTSVTFPSTPCTHRSHRVLVLPRGADAGHIVLPLGSIRFLALERCGPVQHLDSGQCRRGQAGTYVARPITWLTFRFLRIGPSGFASFFGCLPICSCFTGNIFCVGMGVMPLRPF